MVDESRTAAATSLHYDLVVKALKKGRVVPFLGAGVNLCDRPREATWIADQSDFLPSSTELAQYLVEEMKEYTETLSEYAETLRDTKDLSRVSQFLAVMEGSDPLYQQLREVFDEDYPLTSLHHFLAALPMQLKEKGYPRRRNPLYPHFLIVTTNYDDLLERAFIERKQAFHLVYYIACGKKCGSFWYIAPDGKRMLIDSPDSRPDLTEDCPVILKIHGAINRGDDELDSYVITEDDYINYLSRQDVTSRIPDSIINQLERSHLLFLGYGLHDWNLRVILYRLWQERERELRSWAVQMNPKRFDVRFWRARGVEILNDPLSEYTAELKRRVDALEAQGNPDAA